MASPAIPPPKRFPFPYKDTFDSNGYKDQGTVKYFTDQGGSFNAAQAPEVDAGVETVSGGMALHQVVDTRPIEWGHNPDPVTIAGAVASVLLFWNTCYGRRFSNVPSLTATAPPTAGDITWSNYSISAACRIGSVSPLAGGPPPPPPGPPLPPPAPPTPELFAVASAKCDPTATTQKFTLKKSFVALSESTHTSVSAGQQIVYGGGKGCLAATGWNTQVSPLYEDFF